MDAQKHVPASRSSALTRVFLPVAPSVSDVLRKGRGRREEDVQEGSNVVDSSFDDNPRRVYGLVLCDLADGVGLYAWRVSEAFGEGEGGRTEDMVVVGGEGGGRAAVLESEQDRF